MKVCPLRKETMRTDTGAREFFLECVPTCAWWLKGECAVKVNARLELQKLIDREEMTEIGEEFCALSLTT
jgi:hypothetical protein